MKMELVEQMTLDELYDEQRRLIKILAKTNNGTWAHAKRFHAVNCAIRYIKEQRDVANNINTGKDGV